MLKLFSYEKSRIRVMTVVLVIRVMTHELTKQLLEELTPLSWNERLVKLKDYAGEQSIAFSTSFSIEDQAITHVIAKNDLPFRVFTLDTGRMFEQVYDTWQRTRETYANVEIEAFFPDAEAVEKLVHKQGINGFYESVDKRHACCYVRKVEPLARALQGVNIWISGLRREHSENRGELPVVEFDESRNIIKVYPLIDIPVGTIRPYVAKYFVPYNKMQDEGFPSVGCAPCTRAVEPGAHPRSGRWWWEQESAQECGLHMKDGKLVRTKKEDA